MDQGPFSTRATTDHDANIAERQTITVQHGRVPLCRGKEGVRPGASADDVFDMST